MTEADFRTELTAITDWGWTLKFGTCNSGATSVSLMQVCPSEGGHRYCKLILNCFVKFFLQLLITWNCSKLQGAVTAHSFCTSSLPHLENVVCSLREALALKPCIDLLLLRDDLLRAIKKLKVLGNGFGIIPVGGTYLIQSVPAELNMDHTVVLQLAEVLSHKISKYNHLERTLMLPWQRTVIRPGLCKTAHALPTYGLKLMISTQYFSSRFRKRAM